jgi:hypothetical protein
MVGRILADTRVLLRQFEEQHPQFWVLVSILAIVHLKMVLVCCVDIMCHHYCLLLVLSCYLSGSKCCIHACSACPLTFLLLFHKNKNTLASSQLLSHAEAVDIHKQGSAFEFESNLALLWYMWTTSQLLLCFLVVRLFD